MTRYEWVGPCARKELNVIVDLMISQSKTGPYRYFLYLVKYYTYIQDALHIRLGINWFTYRR